MENADITLRETQLINERTYETSEKLINLMISFHNNFEIRSLVRSIIRRGQKNEQSAKKLLFLANKAATEYAGNGGNDVSLRLIAAAFSSTTWGMAADKIKSPPYGGHDIEERWREDIERYCRMSGTKTDFVEFILAAKSAYPGARTRENHQIVWRFRKKYLKLADVCTFDYLEGLHERLLASLLAADRPEIHIGRISGLRKALRLIAEYKESTQGGNHGKRSTNNET